MKRDLNWKDNHYRQTVTHRFSGRDASLINREQRRSRVRHERLDKESQEDLCRRLLRLPEINKAVLPLHYSLRDSFQEYSCITMPFVARRRGSCSRYSTRITKCHRHTHDSFLSLWIISISLLSPSVISCSDTSTYLHPFIIQAFLLPFLFPQRSPRVKRLSHNSLRVVHFKQM